MLKKLFIISVSTIFLTLSMNMDSVKSSTKDYYDLDTDLEEIGEMVENHQILFLGESTHWSRDIIREKIRVIEYLIDNHGYDVLFIESSYPDFNYYASQDEPIDSEHFSDELFNDLFDKSDVTIHAIDVSPAFEGMGASSVPRYEEDVYNELLEFNIEIADEFKRSEYALRNWFADGLIKELDVGTFEREDIYSEIMNQDFYEELSPTTRTFLEEKQFTVENYMKRIDFDTGNYYDVRAEGMADSIEHLLEDDQKAIVWAANGHIFYEPENIKYDHEYFTNSKEIHRTTTMTKILKAKGYDIYNLPVIFNQADEFSLMPSDFSMERVEDSSLLEGYIGNQVGRNVFIDLNNSEWFDNKEFITTRVGLDFRIVPEEQMDGVIYIDYIQE